LQLGCRTKHANLLGLLLAPKKKENFPNNTAFSFGVFVRL
jgi:hypothetical protein